MLVVASVISATGPIKAILGRYLFDTGKGLYIGMVTRRVQGYLRESLHKAVVGKCHVLLAWQEGSSVSGFAVLEFGGDGAQRTQILDGLTFSSK